MNLVKKLYCRSFQNVLKAVKPVLPYKNPVIIDHNAELGKFLKNKGFKKILLLTDKNLIETGAADEVKSILNNSGINVSVFSDIKANPTISNVEEAYKAYKNSNAEAIIALGGGSVIDCAKATGIKIAKPKSDLTKLKGILKVHKKLPYLIAIPTTAGTGSETTISAVLVDEENNDKFAINDFYLAPDVAVLDSKNILSCPRSLRATTGMDALTHAIEAYIGNSLDPKSRAAAIEAMRLIFKNLEENYFINSQASADRMIFASFLAGRAFSRSYVGYVHALAHAVGGFYDTPHGLANAVFLPLVLESYRPVIDKKLYECAVLTGLCSGTVTVKEGADYFMTKIKSLNKSLNIPEHLEDISISDIKALAQHAEIEANPLYPVPVLFETKDLEKIIKKALKEN